MSASAWQISGRWTAAGRESAETFVVLCTTGEREEAQRRGLIALAGYAPPEASKVVAEVTDVERLGDVRNG